jgi:glutamyl-Q tRNA(Asp) synthetase
LTWQPPLSCASPNALRSLSAEIAERLKQDGLVYPCFATRGEISHAVATREASGQPWPRDPDGAPLYPSLHKQLTESEIEARIAAGKSHALRLDMKAALDRIGLAQISWQESGNGPDGETGTISADPSIWGDAVLIRKDIPASYHLSCVIDDAFQNVSHVVRGRDLFHATGLHRLLQILLGLPAPRYHHHRLVLDDAGEKLSKSTGATGLAALRASGSSAARVKAMLYREVT